MIKQILIAFFKSVLLFILAILINYIVKRILEMSCEKLFLDSLYTAAPFIVYVFYTEITSHKKQ